MVDIIRRIHSIIDNHTSTSDLAIAWICMQRTISIIMSLCCFPAKLLDFSMQGFCVIVVSSSNTNITPFFMTQTVDLRIGRIAC